MKIGIFTDAYKPHISGVTTSINMLKDALEEMGHTVYIVTANLFGKGFKYDEAEKTIYIPGIKTHIYNTKLTNIYSGKAIKIIKSWDLDVIHSQTEFGIGVFSRIVAKKLNLPVVHTYHTLYEDYVHYITHGHFDKTAKKMAIGLTRYFCEKKCDELIVPTDKIKELFENKYNIKKDINVIPTGIDIKRFKKNEAIKKEVQKIKNKYKLKNTDFIIGSVSRIAQEKSLDKLILNVKELVLVNPNIKLLIVGDGPDFESLKALVKSLKMEKNIILTGKVLYDQIPAYYNTFDIVASFSTTETQGLTIIEGLAASKPTFCINDESFAPTIEDGYNGYLFDSEIQFRKEVLDIINDKEKYKLMSKNAYNSTHRYSKEVFASDVLKVYHKAIEKKN